MRKHHQAGGFLFWTMVLLVGPLCQVVLLCPLPSRAVDDPAVGYVDRRDSIPGIDFGENSVAKHVCVHGRWNKTRLDCDCDSGWRSGQSTDPLGSLFHWCNYPVAVRPNRSTSEKILRRVSLNPVAAGVFLLVVTCCCCCCVWLCCRFCRRRRRGRRSNAYREEMGEQGWALQRRVVPSMPVPYPEPVWTPAPSVSPYAMSAAMHTNSAMYWPMVSAPWNATSALGPVFYTDGSAYAHGRRCAHMASWPQTFAGAPSSNEPRDASRITAPKGNDGEAQG